MSTENTKVDINEYDTNVLNNSTMAHDTKPEQKNISQTINACTRPPKDETFKEKIARLVRDADKGNLCVSCGGDKMAIVNAADRVIEWVIVKLHKNSTKKKADVDKA